MHTYDTTDAMWCVCFVKLNLLKFSAALKDTWAVCFHVHVELNFSAVYNNVTYAYVHSGCEYA